MTVVNLCWTGDGSGYSYPCHHVVLSQWGLKVNTSSKVVSIDDRCVITTGNVRHVDHESLRMFVTHHNLDWQCWSWLSCLLCMPAGFCGLDPVRAGSCKKFGGQLTKWKAKTVRQKWHPCCTNFSGGICEFFDHCVTDGGVRTLVDGMASQKYNHSDRSAVRWSDEVDIRVSNHRVTIVICCIIHVIGRYMPLSQQTLFLKPRRVKLS